MLDRTTVPLVSPILKGLFTFAQYRFTRRESSYGKIETIYFILSEETGLVKIGKAKNPEERLKTLVVGCPGSMKLIAVFDSVFGIERALHRKFAKYRRNGEWFEFSLEVKKWIWRAFLGEKVWNEDMQRVRREQEALCA